MYRVGRLSNICLYYVYYLFTCIHIYIYMYIHISFYTYNDAYPPIDLEGYVLLRCRRFGNCKMSRKVSRGAFVIICFLQVLCKVSASALLSLVPDGLAQNH